MTTPQTSNKPQISVTQALLRTVQYYLGNRRVLIVLAGIAILGGLTFNWNLLVAAGIAPVLISALPCAAVCAIGVCCVKKSAGQSNSTESSENKPAKAASENSDRVE